MKQQLTWADGDAYEAYVGRWSRSVADEFCRWLDAPPSARWLDVGCGTGSLTSAILRVAHPERVRSRDLSAGYITYARQRIVDPRAEFEVADAASLPDAAHAFDVSVSGLLLNFLPDPHRVLQELVRVTRRGGTIAAYVWDYAGRMQLMRFFWDAAGALDPAARPLDEGGRFPLCRPEALRRLFEGAGLARVEVQGIEVPTRFRDFEDYWSPFLGGQGPAPGYAVGLPNAARERLRRLLQDRLPRDPDGSIPLVARAWAVRGRTSPGDRP